MPPTTGQAAHTCKNKPRLSRFAAWPRRVVTALKWRHVERCSCCVVSNAVGAARSTSSFTSAGHHTGTVTTHARVPNQLHHHTHVVQSAFLEFAGLATAGTGLPCASSENLPLRAAPSRLRSVDRLDVREVPMSAASKASPAALAADTARRRSSAACNSSCSTISASRKNTSSSVVTGTRKRT